MAGVTAADDQKPGPKSEPKSEVDAVIVVPPYEHERLHFFGRRQHHLVPGTVTIDRAPYTCDVDGRHFGERDAFVAHLVAAHHVPQQSIPDRLLVQDGVVHFVGK